MKTIRRFIDYITLIQRKWLAVPQGQSRKKKEENDGTLIKVRGLRQMRKIKAELGF